MIERITDWGRRLLPGRGFGAGAEPGTGRRVVRIAKWTGIVLLALLAVYYPLGMLLISKIDDDVDFQVADNSIPSGGSHAVAMAAALIDREIDVHRWVANDPWFQPAAALDNMPHYQQGIVGALARFAFSMVDQVGRARGSSQTDGDLQDASGQLQYPGNIWVFDLSTSLAPTTPSESRYRKAERALLAYNQRLSEGKAVFERRGDNLQATLDRIALDLGSSSASLEHHVEQYSGAWFDGTADDVFYGVKGQLYAYYLILREMGVDFKNVIAERELGTVWQQMLETMRKAALLEPLVVTNGSPDAMFPPSHLAGQGFYLMRARTQIREITNILQK